MSPTPSRGFSNLERNQASQKASNLAGIPHPTTQLCSKSSTPLLDRVCTYTLVVAAFLLLLEILPAFFDGRVRAITGGR